MFSKTTIVTLKEHDMNRERFKSTNFLITPVFNLIQNLKKKQQRYM